VYLLKFQKKYKPIVPSINVLCSIQYSFEQLSF